MAADAERGVDGGLLLPKYRTRYFEFRDGALVLVCVDEVGGF